jgi:PIN domain nuclease of toxin-antitoxin system
VPAPEIAVTDTHAWIWWLTNQRRRLGRRAAAFFDRVDEGAAVVCIPAIAVVELSEAVRSGRLSLVEPFDVFVDRLELTPSRYQVVPLTAAIVRQSHGLFAISERGDRLIAATAAELGYPLITRDASIAAAVELKRLWS